MPDIFIEKRCPERKGFITFSNEVKPYLPQTKQIKMIDQKGADQNNTKTEKTK